MKEQNAKRLHGVGAALLLLCALLSQSVFGQVATQETMHVSGTIMDENRQPLPGVTVSSSNGTTMVIADEQGQYAIAVPIGDTLQFSHVGYELQKIKPGVNEKLDVVMIGQQGTINEIVVVGYGKQKRVTMTGSVSTITTKDLLQSPVSNLTNALAGRLPGLITTQRSGEPGVDASALYIRGIATLGNARPIVVVDGVERSMDYIDPNDIESFSILKDAASTAVFGMRGANGVVMVTTKRGKRSAPQMSFRTTYGKQEPTKIPEFLGSYDYARLKNEALMNDGNQPAFTDAQLESYKNGTGYNTDYYKFLIQPSQVGNANLNISGGNNIARYFLSAGLNIQEGNYKHTRENDQGYNSNNVMKRFNLRANVDVDVTKDLLVSLNLAGIQTNRSDPNTSAATIMNIMNRMPPIYPITNPDSSLFGNGTYTSNLLGEVSRRGYRIYLNNTIQGTLSAVQKLDVLTKNLSVKLSYSYDNTATPSVSYGKGYAVFYPVYKEDGTIDRYVQVGSDSRIDPNGSFSGGGLERISFVEGAVNWFRQYGKHNITAMGNWNRRLRRSGSAIPYAFQTYLFRGQYNYDSRYMLELNGSYMGSENFPPESRYGLFPSISGGWVISQEKFIDNNSALSFINLLKLRASYGEVGNDQVGSERFLWFTSWAGAGQYWFGTGNNPTQANGWAQGAIGNPGVTWERGRKLNLAIEGSLWNDALSFTVEAFKERRSNILISRGTLTDVFGQNIKPQNLGIVDNKGIDIDLGHKMTIGEFFYFVKGNFTYAKNKVVFQDEVARTNPWMYRTGLPIGTKYGLVYTGFFQSQAEVDASAQQFGTVRPGDLKYLDLDGDGKVLAGYDEQPIGYSRTPEIMYGFSAGGGYKGLDFSILFQGAAHASAMLNNEAVYEFFQEGKVKPFHLNRWTPETAATATYPLLHNSTNANNHRGSSFWIRSADYLRIKNVEIGYTLPARWTQTLKLKSTRFFVNGMNVFTFKNALDDYFVDPEIDDGYGAMYPIQKIWAFGIDINF
ncbi:SusC/RagA family TonB-linked outer membrane protein [Niabella drilacis]|uniref:TonB-linked outer membrane protein, SusC/RagA family n=1 Tax=Niabella drilacis (strain DSM 25811 / CCM 8410 / CCUG 62505 / LMG 26954 / E90) TaxID=1285928 RepID=A0A1G6JKE3_NIADE|nr:TonB-dependent receptor [Niabella drilacis]SDC19128.1 TonB-linked outer membrane protein, SusC/RagA family [Niabella drilacis]